MKKLLSAFLAIILVFTIISPISVFAENGPYPNDFESTDWENIDLENLDLANLKMSAIMFLDINAIFENPLDAIGLVYPATEELPLSPVFSGASYDKETNTLTLKNVKSKTVILAVLGMGDDFKIKLEGYNEFAAILSSGMEWGGSVTLTGNGELVVGRSEEAFFTGIIVEADNTASVFQVEDTVKLKVYSNPDFYMDAVSVIGSTVLDPAEIIKIGGNVVADEPVFNKYVVEKFEQIEAHDLSYTMDYYDIGLKKNGVYYIGFEQITEEYSLYAAKYDETLDCYFLEYTDSTAPWNPTTAGFEIVAVEKPVYDKENDAYIGFGLDHEGNPKYKKVYLLEAKQPFDLCVDENGTKYGFWQYTYDYGDGTSETITYIYNLIEHPVYDWLAIEDESKTTLDGLTPLKIGEKEYADSYISSDVVVNNGGAVVEPDTIKGIKATNHKDGVKVSWTADSSAEQYIIYRKTSKNGNWKALDTIDADETTFIDKTVKSGTKYYYTVKGSNYVGSGSYNKNGVTVTYVASPKVTAKNTSKGIHISWSKIAKAEKYRIYRQTNGSSKWTLIDTVKSTSFTDKTAKSGTKYNYRVRAVIGSTLSGYNEASKYFLAAPKLSSVKNASSGVEVSWGKVSGAEGYKVYRKSGSGSYKHIGTTSKTSYTDTTAKSGTTYTYTVKAYKSKTDSAYNKTGLKLKYLATPKAKTTVYTSSISVSWSKVTGAKEYAVYRKASGESKWKKVTTTTKTSYKDTNVKNNKTYSYRVRAVNGKTTSAYKTIKQLFLSTPKLSSVKNITSGTTLKWGKVSGADGYKVYRKTGSGDFKLIGTAEKNTYTDYTTKNGTVYTYTVRAYNDNATSYYDKTGLKIRFVDTVFLYIPENTKNGFLLSWHAADKVDKYYIYREVDGTNTKKQIAVLEPDEIQIKQDDILMYTDKNVKNGETYAYYIRTYYKGSFSDYICPFGKYSIRLESVDVTSAKATSNGIKVKWEKSPYATSYSIERKEKGSDEMPVYFGIEGGNTTTYLDKNVESGKTYTYTVTAGCHKYGGKSGRSADGGSKSAKAK